MTRLALNIRSRKGFVILGLLIISMVPMSCGKDKDADANRSRPTVDTAITTEAPSSVDTVVAPTNTPAAATEVPVPTTVPTQEPSFSERLLSSLENMPLSCIYLPYETLGMEDLCGDGDNPFHLTDSEDVDCFLSSWGGPSTMKPQAVSGAFYGVGDSPSSDAGYVAFEFSSLEETGAFFDLLKETISFDQLWPWYQSDNVLVLTEGDYIVDEEHCYSSLHNLIMAEGATVVTPQVKLRGFDYTLQDSGDGWNNGSLRFAIESRWPFPLHLGDLDIRGGAILETREGPTYPVDIRRADGQNGWFVVVPGPILPGFAVRGVGAGFDAGQPDLILSWKSAAAATPTRIVFPDYPNLELDVPVQNLGYSSAYSLVSIPAISEAKDLALIDYSSGLQVILNGACFPTTPAMNTETLAIVANFKNNDMFQEVNIQNDLQVMQVSVLNTDTGHQSYQDFIRSYDESGNSLFRLGPGQSSWGLLAIEDKTRHGFGANSDIVFWLPDGSYRTYDLTECISGTN